jgi:membrane protein YqaA with SNARE-associated domain
MNESAAAMTAGVIGALIVIAVWLFVTGWLVTVVAGWLGADLSLWQGALIVLLVGAIARAGSR